jgi:hypothetical protein
MHANKTPFVRYVGIAPLMQVEDARRTQICSWMTKNIPAEQDNVLGLSFWNLH